MRRKAWVSLLAAALSWAAPTGKSAEDDWAAPRSRLSEGGASAS